MAANCFFFIYPPTSPLVWSVASIVPSAATDTTFSLFF
jgi:hypothetical protein